MSSTRTASSYYDEMPEIPFVSSTTLPCANTWAELNRFPSRPVIEDVTERSFWSLMRPSISKVTDRSDGVFGHANDRIFNPPRPRERSGSISSIATASSRTKPAPAKSILSSSSSIKTKTRRSPPSVKFLDVPEVHYEDEYEDAMPSYHYHHSCAPASSTSASVHAHPHTVPKKSGFLRWIPWATKKTQSPPCGRPSISGPFPLSEAPPRRARDGAASLRSVRSKDSLCSVQSHSSRLQSYWHKLTGKVP